MFLKRLFCVAVLLVLVSSFLASDRSIAQGTSASETICLPCEDRTAYPIMRVDGDTLQEWSDLYYNAPRAYLNPEFVPQNRSFSLLDHLEYTPSERDQENCGNCWVWTGTGVLEVALDVEEGIRDRLSIQYFTSCYNGGTGPGWAYYGGNIFDFAAWYQDKGFAVPWSNTNAYWQDGNQPAEDGTSVPGYTISTSPNYPLSRCTAKTIETHNVGQTQAINNIKNILQQDKAVYFSFDLPNTEPARDWNVFVDFWNHQPESAIWNPDYSFGHTWNEDEGASHAVLCVGYDDVDPNDPYWIMVNSWGTADGGRPSGIFHVDMDMNYDCTIDDNGTNVHNLDWATLDVGFVHSETLSYDDGVPEQGAYWTGSGGMYAVRFTPRVAGQLTRFSFCVFSDPATVRVYVWDSRGDVITPFSYTPTSAGWKGFLLSLPINVSSGVDFYVGIEWTEAKKPCLGDDTSDPDGRSYNWNGTQWSQHTSGDYLIRAVIETVRGMELYYDDGVPETGWNWPVAGNMFAVRFTPLMTGRLMECSFCIGGDLATVKVHVKDSSKRDIKTFSYTPTSAGWCYVDLSAYKINVTSGVDFYVAIEWTEAKKPSLGDDTSDPDGRSYDYYGGQWLQYTDGDYLIRAAIGTEAPDLIVSDLSWSPAYPIEGDMVTFTVYIRNQGAGDAGSFKIWYHIAGSAGSVWHEFAGNLSITSLSAGKTTNATFTWNATEGSDYTVQVQADIGRSIAEIVETNNEKTITHAFYVAPKPKPDLIISDISWVPETPANGDTVTFTVIVKNNGTANAEPFQTAYYIDQTKLGEWSIASLSVAQEVNKTFTWTYIEGSYTVKAIADSNNEIQEEDETNNMREETIGRALVNHDVAITEISLYRTIVSNRTMTSMNVTVQNQGDVQETFTIILSYNSTAFGSQITTVSNGSSIALSFSWNTTGVSLGNYTIAATVDQLPEETDTTDNSQSTQVQVSILGDINGDGRVDMKDVSKLAQAFTVSMTSPKWVSNGDLDENKTIDMKDISRVAIHFSEHT